MKLLDKRIWILFSVALNIGFVLMVIIMAYHNSKSFYERSWPELVQIVQGLKLQKAQENAALELMKQFGVKIDKLDQDIKDARSNTLRFLGKNGKLDREQLHRLVETINYQEKLKNGAFENHVIEFRNLLGDEKGALFFSLLLEHLESEHKLPPR